MFLKLTHRRAYAGTAPLAPPPPAEVPEQYASPSVKRILERLARAGGGAVLDLGALSGDTLTTFAEAGARVHVHDVVSRLRDAPDGGVPDIGRLLGAVRVAPATIDVLCAWELFDVLPFAAAQEALAVMSRWLVPKGWVLAVFNTTAPAGVHRFRVAADGLVRAEPAGALGQAVAVTTNSQVAQLFAGFTLVHSAMVRGQAREVLAQRQD